MLELIFRKCLRRKGLTFWWLPTALLWLVSLGYRIAYYLHRSIVKASVEVAHPVISIGNITVGGTGKTPMVICLGKHFEAAGIRVGVVSRGYARRERQGIIAPGYQIQTMDTTVTGDEVMLMAHLLPRAVFSIDNSKAQAAERLAESGEIDVIVVDDGFQHTALHRDVDLVTFDAAVPSRMLRWFPFGLLREPLSALKRADVVVATRAIFARDIGILRKQLHAIAPEAHHYTAQFVSTELVGHDQTLPLKYIEDKSVLLFAGVGNFKPLRRQVAALCDLDDALEFSDHQHYDLPLLERIKAEAERHDSDVILTTGKDWVNLPDFGFGREIYYLSQSVDLDPGEEQLIQYLTDKLDLEQQER